MLYKHPHKQYPRLLVISFTRTPYLFQRFPMVCFLFLRRVYPRKYLNFPTTQSRCSQEINELIIGLYFLADAYTHSFPFRVSYLNTHSTSFVPASAPAPHIVRSSFIPLHYAMRLSLRSDRRRSLHCIPSLHTIHPPFPAVFISFLRSVHPEISVFKLNYCKSKRKNEKIAKEFLASTNPRSRPSRSSPPGFG